MTAKLFTFQGTSVSADTVTKFFDILEFGPMSREEESFFDTFLPKFRSHMVRELGHSSLSIAAQSDQ